MLAISRHASAHGGFLFCRSKQKITKEMKIGSKTLPEKSSFPSLPSVRFVPGLTLFGYSEFVIIFTFRVTSDQISGCTSVMAKTTNNRTCHQQFKPNKTYEQTKH
jgi:hypothetical protein